MTELKRVSFEKGPKKLKELEKEDKKPGEAEDDVTCNNQLPCGANHLCQKDKGHPGECGDCTFVRKYLQECGHWIVEKCYYRNVANIPPMLCERICDTLQRCGHHCRRSCYACDGKCAPVLCDVCELARERAVKAWGAGVGPSGSQQQKHPQPFAFNFQNSLNLSSVPPPPPLSPASTSAEFNVIGSKCSEETDSGTNEESADFDGIVGTTTEDSDSEVPGTQSPSSAYDDDVWKDVFFVSE